VEAIVLTAITLLLIVGGFALLARGWPSSYRRGGYRVWHPDRPDVTVPEEGEPPRWKTESSDADADPSGSDADRA